MIVFPNCKINLGLHIISKREDGFHNIETVFYPVNLKDALEILPSDKDFHFSLTGLNLDSEPESNLCVKAYQLLKTDFPQVGNIQMHLHKVIPSGAGLGGGSSNAAFTIKLLDDIFNLSLNVIKMQEYCRKLGSDCAFFIKNKATLAAGKGDIFSPLTVDLSSYKIIIVKPPIFISTSEAYSNVKPYKPAILIKEILQKPISTWKGILVNDFESSLFSFYPILPKIKEKLYELGAIYASMSGSGSAFYGIFEKSVILHLEDSFPDCFIWEEM